MDPRDRAIAYRALAHDLESGIIYLPDYLQTVDDPKRRGELVRDALRQLLGHGSMLCRDRLRHHRQRLDQIEGLVDAVDAALVALGEFPVFKEAPVLPIAGPTLVSKQSRLNNLAALKPVLRIAGA